MSKKKTKILKVKYSAESFKAMMMFGAGLVILALALVIAFRSYGQGDSGVALMGLLSLVLSIIGLKIGIMDIVTRPREDSKPTLSKVAIGCNIAEIIAVITIYVIGIVI